MRIYTCLQIGETHTNHCEDYVVHLALGKNRLLVAVMDGCTMGTDSYWIATTVGKVLRKVAKEIDYQEFAESVLPLLQLQKQILQTLFATLQRLQNDLQMQADEMLCTLNLLLLDVQTREAETLTVGDGLVVWNGNIQEYEQNNFPDYLGYHLREDFESWYAKQTQTLHLENIIDITLASDGIFTFEEQDNSFIVQTLCISPIDTDHKKALTSKINQLAKKPKDDLAIVRVIL
jgi:hypothetical protein